jgi:hypothetical protein
MCLRLKLLGLIFKNYSLGVAFYFKFLAIFLLFTFFFEFAHFFPFFSQQELSN